MLSHFLGDIANRLGYLGMEPDRWNRSREVVSLSARGRSPWPCFTFGISLRCKDQRLLSRSVDR